VRSLIVRRVGYWVVGAVGLCGNGYMHRNLAKQRVSLKLEDNCDSVIGLCKDLRREVTVKTVVAKYME
jgi:hypothetical protein